MEDCTTHSNRTELDEQRQQLDLLEEPKEISRMKQTNPHQSTSAESAVVDGEDCMKCDETPDPPVGDGVPEGVDDSDPDYVEERFRVDRRKLEQLIQVSEDQEENAEEFFIKIMQETNTHIAWPSKLKIGAKSKKDPHIKVSGHRDAVSEAKNRILAILDTKSLRVTLKMDVSHTEHSHVIGKSGHNIKRVMQETGCHIHFPDSNRNNQAEKSNQVSIAGQCEGVELARQRIRELLPLVFMFEVPMAGPNQVNIDTNSAVIQNIQHHYGVSISIKPHHQTYTRTVIIRGSVYNSKSVKKAASMVFELLTGRIGEAFGVSMLLEIAAQHHLFIIGHGGVNISRIMQQTGATIHFPDPTTSGPQRRGAVYITGTMSSVFHARHQLLGCLPLVLMFDLKDDVEVGQGLLSQLTDQLDVFISIKPKPKQTTKSVIVKTIESNTRNVYEARRRILGIAQESPSLMPEPKQTIADLCGEIPDFHGQNLAGSGALITVNSSRSPVPGVEPRPTSVTNIGSPSPVYRPMIMLPRPHPHQAALQYPPSYPAPPMCYLPPQVPREWSPYRSAHPYPQQQQQQTHSGPFALSPNAMTSVLSSSEELIQHMTSALSLPQMPSASSFSPSPVDISSHNVRNAAEVVLPPASLPHLASPLSLDLLASEFASSLSDPSAALVAHRLDSLNGIFEAKSVRHEDFKQHPLLRNHLGPPITGLDCRHSDAAAGGFGPPHPCSIALSQQLYSSDIGCSSHAAIYHHHPLQPNTCPASAAGSSSASVLYHNSSRPPHFQHPHHPSQHHEGIFQPMPDHSNDVYHATPMTTNPALDAASATAQGPYHPSPSSGAIYSNGTKETMAALDEERHDLLDENQQRIFCVQNSDVDRDGEYESDSSSERSSSSKAPGNNRPMKSINSSSQFEHGAFLNDIDYEHMKMLASKAMQKKPVGESRIPTDYWAGLGFSRSMPASAIRERLNLSDSGYDGPKMTTPYEDVEEDSEAWKNDTDHSLSNSANPMAASDNLMMDLVSQLSAQCRELSLQPDRCNITQIDGCHQLAAKTSSSSSIWQPLSEKQMDRVAIGDTDLSLLFSEMGLGKYTELFKQQEIDMATFLTLTDQDLKDLGISTFGARRKMLLAIADLNKRQSVLPPPPGLPNPFRDAGIIQRHDIVSQSVRW